VEPLTGRATGGLRTGSPLGRLLERQGFVVLDGGLATALEAAGHRLDTALWSARLLIDAPDAIRAVHRAYLEAGADCITTATYQASVPGFRAAGLSEEEGEALIARSVALACDERDRYWAEIDEATDRLRPLVAASVGPYGAYLADGSEYDGRYGVGPNELRAFHGSRLRQLAASGADLLACETIPSAAEAEALLELLDELPGTHAWVSFSCRDGAHLHDGTPLRAVARACATHEAVVAVGVNCTAPSFIVDLVGSIGDLGRPVLAYPNSGEAYDAVTKRWHETGEPGRWIEGVDAWVDAGASVVGGCCRVGPDEIRALRSRLEERSARSGHRTGQAAAPRGERMEP